MYIYMIIYACPKLEYHRIPFVAKSLYAEIWEYL
jgi:hypothetical protein